MELCQILVSLFFSLALPQVYYLKIEIKNKTKDIYESDLEKWNSNHTFNLKTDCISKFN